MNVADVSFAAVSCCIAVVGGNENNKDNRDTGQHINTGNKIAGRRGID